MSLYALPVSSSDLTALQQGIQFFTNPAEATSQANAISANQPNGPTVFSYAQQLLASNLSLSQVAMADSAYALGTTNTVAGLTGISTQFLPPQVQFALDHPEIQGGPTVFAAQVYALALAGGANTAFRTQLELQLLNDTFFTTTATLTGTNVAAIQQFFDNWFAFYSASPEAAPGLTAQVAAAASAWGDAMGVALVRGSTDTGPGIEAARAIQNAVANALFLIAQTSSSPPGQTYQAGVAIGALPTHTDFQGETGPITTLNFTLGTDQFTGADTNGNTTYNGVISQNGTAINTPPSTLSPLQQDSANDSDGNDTINLIVFDAAGASLSAVASLVLGVEKWSINQTQGPITDGPIDVSTLNSANFIEQIGPTFVDVTNVGTDDTVGFTSTTTGPVNNAITVATGVNSAKVQLKDVGAVALTFAETTAGDLTRVEVGGNPGANLVIDLTAAAVNIVVLGITSTTPTPITLTGATISLQTIDAQTSTGGLTLDVSGAGLFPNVNSVTLGSGNDNLTDELANKGPVTTVTENLGAGDDTFNVGLSTPAQNVAMNITLGTGSDNVVVTNGNIANIAVPPVPANLEQGLVTIADFNLAGGDVLNIAAPFDPTTPQEQNAISAAATLFAAVTLAAANTNAGGSFTVFNYGANAYVFENNTNQALETGDGLIQLVGVQTGPLIAATGTQFIHL